MKIPIFKGNGKVEYCPYSKPELNRHFNVLVEVAACGICGTDLNILSVPPMHKAKEGIILGHEAVGNIVDIEGGGDFDLALGDRVVVAPRILCGNCQYCRMGLPHQCTNYQTIGTSCDGAFAPYLAAPHTALYKISDRVTVEKAALFEPLSCVIGAVKPIPFQLGDSVAIIGAGPMGMLFALVYKSMGAGKIIAIDTSESRLSFLSSIGFDDCINPKNYDEQALNSLYASIQADIVVDAVGNQGAATSKLLRRGGHAVLFGLKAGQSINIQQYDLTRNEHSLHGSFVGLLPFVQTIKVLESDVLDPSVIVTHKLKLDSLLDGIEMMRRQEGMKLLIDMSMSS